MILLHNLIYRNSIHWQKCRLCSTYLFRCDCVATMGGTAFFGAWFRLRTFYYFFGGFMAIINCPECGKGVSSRASSCPNCGCPIEFFITNAPVKIKASVLHSPTGFNGNQKVSIMVDDVIIWQGFSGEIAELYFDEPTNITVEYHFSLMHYGGTCSGIIDPSKSKKYNISARQGFMSTKLVLQAVDVFDAD